MTFFSDSMLIIRPRVSFNVGTCFCCYCVNAKKLNIELEEAVIIIYILASHCVCVCVCLCSDNVGKKSKKKKGSLWNWAMSGLWIILSRSKFSGKRHCCWVRNCILLVLFGLPLMSQDRIVEHSAEFCNIEPCSIKTSTRTAAREIKCLFWSEKRLVCSENTLAYNSHTLWDNVC